MSKSVEEIAAGLTEAQREALLCISVDPTRWTNVGFLHRASFKALERRKLVSHWIVGMVSCARCTPLGEQVRAVLKEETQNANG